MRRHAVRFAVVLTLCSFSGRPAWSHGEPTGNANGSHSRHGGGGGGGFAGAAAPGGHTGFGGLGHAGHHSIGSIAGFDGGGHGERHFDAPPHNTANFGNAGFGPGQHIGGDVGGSHHGQSSIDARSIGSAPGRGNRMTSGITFPVSPALLAAGGSASGRHHSSFVQNQVRNAAAVPAKHQHDGQIVLAAEQHPKAGPEGGQKIAEHRQEPLKAQEAEHRGPGDHEHGDHRHWRNRSYFFGPATPLDDSSSASNNSFVYPWWLFGYGYGYGFGLGYSGGGYSADYGLHYQNTVRPIYASYAGGGPKARLVSAVQLDDEVPADQVESALSFAEQGEVDFKAGKYKLAVQSWRHALVDDPRNGAIVLLLGQAFFALGQYEESAAATQAALAMLPEEKWGAVVTHYKELYSNVADYTTQIRALEKARDEKPDAPALHFLLGYHFGYLNYPKHAVRELDKVLAVVPKDKIAQKLRDEFAAKLSEEDKAALEKQAKKAAADGKPADDAKPSKPAESTDKPADDQDKDKDDESKKEGDTKDGDKNEDGKKDEAPKKGVEI